MLRIGPLLKLAGPQRPVVALNCSTWPLLGAAAESGTPKSAATTVAACVPVTSPASAPVDEAAVSAVAAAATLPAI